MIGTLGILNVGDGDTKLTFDPSKPAEVERSARIVKDMIRRGFVLLVEVGSDDKGPMYRRAHDFDETTAEYIIAGTVDLPAETESKAHEQKPRSATPRSRQGQAKRTTTRIPASRTNAVSVARTAGG